MGAAAASAAIVSRNPADPTDEIGVVRARGRDRRRPGGGRGATGGGALRGGAGAGAGRCPEPRGGPGRGGRGRAGRSDPARGGKADHRGAGRGRPHRGSPALPRPGGARCRRRDVPAGRRPLAAHVAAAAARGGRADHALELPDRHPRLEARAGARLRQRVRVEALAACARLRRGAARRASCRSCPSRRWSSCRATATRAPCWSATRGVAAVSFTGSVATGAAVARMAVERGAAVQCEMGGQNASIVLADADLESAAATIAGAAMGYAGQKCTATSRVICDASVHDAMRDALVAAVAGMRVEDPADEACRVGPLITAEARDAAVAAVGRGVEAGGRVLTGGEALDAAGSYLAPALVEIDDPAAELAQEEVFAPVCALMRTADADAAVALANGVRHGLVTSIFTRDLDRVLDLVHAARHRARAREPADVGRRPAHAVRRREGLGARAARSRARRRASSTPACARC